jgi:hypothetical protein
MITMRLTLLTLIACAGSSLAGEIYGTIKENGKPVEKGIPVSITPGTPVSITPGTPASGTPAADSVAKETDEFGGYRIFVPEAGPYTVSITYKGKSISCAIQSYTKPTRFDLVVESTNGQYTLRRQ